MLVNDKKKKKNLFIVPALYWISIIFLLNVCCFVIYVVKIRLSLFMTCSGLKTTFLVLSGLWRLFYCIKRSPWAKSWRTVSAQNKTTDWRALPLQDLYIVTAFVDCQPTIKWRMNISCSDVTKTSTSGGSIYSPRSMIRA